MDFSSILSTLLSTSSVSNIAKATETEKSDVQNVIKAALPTLVTSALSQSKNKSTADIFTDALADHAETGTSNLSTFFKNIDLSDGTKIIKHLLGDSTSETTGEIAKEAGVTKKNAMNILSALAPLFMSLLGQITNANSSSETTSTIVKSLTSLTKGVDVSSLLGDLLGSAISSKTSSKSTTAKKSTGTKKVTKSKSSAGDTLSTIASLAGKLLK